MCVSICVSMSAPSARLYGIGHLRKNVPFRIEQDAQTRAGLFSR